MESQKKKEVKESERGMKETGKDKINRGTKGK